MTEITKPQTMAERHADEVAIIIAEGEAKLAPHKELAHWSERSGRPKPAGWTRRGVAAAVRAVAAGRAEISKQIREACLRYVAKTNAPPAQPN